MLLHFTIPTLTLGFRSLCECAEKTRGEAHSNLHSPAQLSPLSADTHWTGGRQSHAPHESAPTLRLSSRRGFTSSEDLSRGNLYCADTWPAAIQSDLRLFNIRQIKILRVSIFTSMLPTIADMQIFDKPKSNMLELHLSKCAKFAHLLGKSLFDTMKCVKAMMETYLLNTKGNVSRLMSFDIPAVSFWMWLQCENVGNVHQRT